MHRLKRKNIILISLVAVTCVISYKMAISKTLDLRKAYGMLNKEVQLYDDLPSQIAILKKKEKQYDSIFSVYQLDRGSMQQNLLNVLTTLSNKHNVILVSFIEPHIAFENELQVDTYTFTLEGNYNDMSSLIYSLETKTKIGAIISLQFEKKAKAKSRKESLLQATVLIQTLN